MQTFLPYSDFSDSASCLDYRRLGKQRVEAMQIINVLEGKAKKTKTGKIAWQNHPAVLMWKNNIDALKLYCNIIIKEWISRGYKNNMSFYIIDKNNIEMPKWLGNNEFHKSHRSNLLRKDFNYYSKFGWKESDNLPYIWNKVD